MTSTPAHEPPTSNGGHIRGNPIAWTSVALVCGGFVVGGIALIEALPWLFYVGIAVAAVGGLLSWLTHAMSNVRDRVKVPVRSASTAGDGEPVEHPEPA